MKRRAAIRRSRRAHGFTLLEILFALVLLSFVMLGVWGALRGATRVTRATDDVLARSEAVRMTQQFLRRYVGAAGPQPFLPEGGDAARMFRGAAEGMTYVAPLPAQSGHAGLYLQTVSLATTGGSKALVLAYRPYSGDAGDAGAGAGPVTHRLLTDLRGGSFQYLAAGAFGQPAEWRDDWPSVNGLPLAVRIRLEPGWRVRVPFPEMVIPLRTGQGFGAKVGAAR